MNEILKITKDPNEYETPKQFFDRIKSTNIKTENPGKNINKIQILNYLCNPIFSYLETNEGKPLMFEVKDQGVIFIDDAVKDNKTLEITAETSNAFSGKDDFSTLAPSKKYNFNKIKLLVEKYLSKNVEPVKDSYNMIEGTQKPVRRMGGYILMTDD